MHPLRAGVLNTRRRSRLATGAARYAVMCGRCDSRCVAQGGVSRPSEARRARTLNETPFFDARETLERTAPRGAPRSAQRAQQRQRKLGPCRMHTDTRGRCCSGATHGAARRAPTLRPSATVGGAAAAGRAASCDQSGTAVRPVKHLRRARCVQSPSHALGAP